MKGLIIIPLRIVSVVALTEVHQAGEDTSQDFNHDSTGYIVIWTSTSQVGH